MRRLKFKPRAIIFDMDGVIIDSMPYHFLAWYEALRPYGVRVSCFDVYAREGENWEKTLRDLLSRAKIKPTASLLKEIFLKRQKIFKRYFKRFIFSRPSSESGRRDPVQIAKDAKTGKGLQDYLLCLKKQSYILGLVTGSPIEEVNKILPLKILSLFDSLVAGNQVRRGKPYPDPYIKCARLIGLRPNQCVVVENAPLGIESAKKAGMFCVALTTSLPKEYLKEADIVADNLGDIPKIIEHVCKLAASR